MSKVELNQNYVPKRTIQQLPDWGDKTSVSICPSVSGHNKLTIPHNPKSGLENKHFCVYIFNRTVPAGIFSFFLTTVKALKWILHSDTDVLSQRDCFILNQKLLVNILKNIWCSLFIVSNLRWNLQLEQNRSHPDGSVAL